MAIITLSTDFGLKDGNVGVMKGVILGIAPDTQLVDLTHLIGPQNVLEAALTLARSAPYFPPGTIHIVVVDPGVGTARRPMAARLGNQFYIGPDNGAITRWLQQVEGAGGNAHFVHLNRPQYWLPEVSHVFHGRDIFAPCAARQAAGIPIDALGDRIEAPVLLDLPQPFRTSTGWQAEIVHIDHFGNLISSLEASHLAGQVVKRVNIKGRLIAGLVCTFGERPPGELVALYGSTGFLIVSEVNGSAAARLGAKVGDLLTVEISA